MKTRIFVDNKNIPAFDMALKKLKEQHNDTLTIRNTVGTAEGLQYIFEHEKSEPLFFLGYYYNECKRILE